MSASPAVEFPELKLAARNSKLGTESAFAVAARVHQLRSEGRDVADLSIGEPDLPTPECIVEAGFRALRDGATRYTPPAGLPQLRAAIAADLNRTAEPPSRRAAENVFVTPGAKPALLYALLATVGPGDEVLVPDPGFSPYSSQVRLAGATPVPYAAGRLEDGVTPRTRAVIVNSPGNPTGAALGLAALIAVADLAERHDLWIISDEIYSRIWFGDGAKAPSIAQLHGLEARTIVIDGFSKAWRMTGWRLGYAVVPTRLETTFERIIVNAHSCVPGFVQQAGVAALDAGESVVTDYVGQLRSRRDTLVEALNTLPGVSCRTPEGAFYAFPDCSRLIEDIWDSEEGQQGRCRRTVPLVRRQLPRWPPATRPPEGDSARAAKEQPASRIAAEPPSRRAAEPPSRRAAPSAPMLPPGDALHQRRT